MDSTFEASLSESGRERSASATAPMEDILRRHYRNLADTYNDFLSYSPDFIRLHTSKMIRALDLHEDDVLVDLGCGTGMYSLDILEQVPLKAPVIGVDPFQEMLAQIPPDAPFERVAEDAVAFSEDLPDDCTKILMKEAIHHIDRKQTLFENLYRRLPAGGRLLLVHVPPDIEYPLFSRALERARTWHAHPDELTVMLQRAGFRVDCDTLNHDHQIRRDDYFRMVEHRYMSLLTSFADEELAAGLEEMRETYAEQEVLKFTDRFDYIAAIKE